MNFLQFREFLNSWGLSFDTPSGESSTIPYPAVYTRMMDDALAQGGQKLADMINGITDTIDGQTSLNAEDWTPIEKEWNNTYST